MDFKKKQRENIKALIGYYTIGVLMLFFQSGLLSAQVPYKPSISDPLFESWRWRSIDVLATKGVRCMADDPDGNMWFGLDKGIMRYDGYDWVSYDDQEYLKFPVGILFLTGSGQLLAGSEAGLLAYESGQWKRIFPRTDSLHVAVTAITEMPDGTILAGIQNGLLMVKNEQVSVFTVLQRANAFRQDHPYANITVLPDEVLFQRNFGRVDNIYLEDSELIWLFLSRNNDGKLLKFQLTDTLNQVLQKFEVTEELGGFKLPNRNEGLRSSSKELWIINGF